MSSLSVPSVSTALIPYDPTLPHISIKARLETSVEATRRADSASRKVLEDQYINTYKALHLGGKDTLESRMIRSAIAFCPTHDEKETAQRLSNYNKVAKYLSQLTNEQLSTLLTTAKSLGSGTGGEVMSIEMEGVPVFVKKIRLTAIEKENPRSTQNLFELPSYYQYGVGSMGFGVWRELAAHEMTTQWILNGECQNFPLMYHSRVLERSHPLPKSPMPEELEERQRYVNYWDGSTAVGRRSEAADTASADVVVFMESFPQTLKKWLSVEGGKANLRKIEHELSLVAEFMKSRGFLHFDAHFHNILANDNHIYFADFGLATSRKFDLSPEERAFLERHIDYDRYYVIGELARRAIALTLKDEEGEIALNEYFSPKKMTIVLPPAIESIAQRYRPIAILMDNFFRDLREHSKTTPYPEAELAREWSKLKNLFA
jgi:hypothetical protein